MVKNRASQVKQPGFKSSTLSSGKLSPQARILICRWISHGQSGRLGGYSPWGRKKVGYDLAVNNKDGDSY